MNNKAVTVTLRVL